MKINNFPGTDVFSTISKISPAELKNDKVKLNDFYKKPVSINEAKQWGKNEDSELNKCPKWDLNKIPLSFFINYNNDQENFFPEFINAARSAFLPWSRGSYGRIRFLETFNKDNADIILSWSDVTIFGRDFESGHTDLKVVNHRIEKAEITIVIYPIIDKQLSPAKRIERVRRTTLHEAGHALGLNHSNSRKDVMYHRGIDNKNLSDNDIRRINELYSSNNSGVIS
jgi:predicted Zn-dependent protease